jgi:hypothetical protein
MFAQTNTLPAAGNVGIGTTTPSALLDVNGNMVVDSSVVIKDSLNVQKKLIVDQDLKIKGESVFVGDGKFKDKLVVDGLTKLNGDLKIKSLENTALTTSRLLSILPNGKVEIANITLPPDDTFTCLNTLPWSFADGTNTDDDIILCPNFKSVTIGGDFTVGNLTRLGVSGIGTTPNTLYQMNIASINKTAGIRLLSLGTNTYGIQNIVTNNNVKAFAVTQSTGNKDVFVVTGDGRVGIGTNALNDLDFSNNLYKLSVEGAIRSRSIVVNANNWADFVFEKNYNLRTLKSLENYINENKHLPDVPTTKDVNENGVSLGDMNAILLRKVEELTLYIIEQNKRINKLEEKIN